MSASREHAMSEASNCLLKRAAVRALSALALILTIHGSGAAGDPFSLTPTMNPLTLQQNAGGTDTITVTNAAGFSGSVSLAVSGVPTGVGTAIAGNLLIVFPALSTPVGSYTLTVTGTSGKTKVSTSSHWSSRRGRRSAWRRRRRTSA